MVRIVPSPVLSSPVVVEEHPLHAFEVSEQQLVQCSLSFHLLDVKLEFLKIVAPLCLVGVFFISLDEVAHELMVALNILVGLLLRDLNLLIDVLVQLHRLDLVLTCAFDL